MPNNLYGPYDSYDLESSHVLPALVRKFHLAKLAGQGDWDGIERDETCYGPIPADIRAGLISISKHNGFDPPRLNVKSPLPEPAVVLWGSGSPRREFLYSDDLADACLFLMNRIEDFITPEKSSLGAYHLVNIGWGQDQTIRELADLVAKRIGFEESNNCMLLVY